MSVLHIAGWINLCSEADLGINGVERSVPVVRWKTAEGRMTKWHVPEALGGETRVTAGGVAVAESRMEVLMRCGVLFSDDAVAEWDVEKKQVAVDRGWLDWPADLLAEVCGACVHYLPRHEADWLYADGQGSLLSRRVRVRGLES